MEIYFPLLLPMKAAGVPACSNWGNTRPLAFSDSDDNDDDKTKQQVGERDLQLPSCFS